MMQLDVDGNPAGMGGGLSGWSSFIQASCTISHSLTHFPRVYAHKCRYLSKYHEGKFHANLEEFGGNFLLSNGRSPKWAFLYG